MIRFCIQIQFIGERLIQYASENLVTEILIHPQYNTLIQCMRNLLSSFTRHRHIIHAGYTFSGNGSWILQVTGFKGISFSTFVYYDLGRGSLGHLELALCSDFAQRYNIHVPCFVFNRCHLHMPTLIMDVVLRQTHANTI